MRMKNILLRRGYISHAHYPGIPRYPFTNATQRGAAEGMNLYGTQLHA